MKKRFLSLLIVLAVMMAIAVPATAQSDLAAVWEDGRYEGTVRDYSFPYQDIHTPNMGGTVVAEKSGDNVDMTIILNDGRVITIGGTVDSYVDANYDWNNGYWRPVTYNDGSYDGTAYQNFDIKYDDSTGLFSCGGGEIWDSAGTDGVYLALVYDIEFKKADDGEEPEVPAILEKVISGVATSKTGEYMVSIGGKVKGAFAEGRHQITANGQEITIFAMNTLNGATRVMNAGTINSMYVTVEGGVITKVQIAGRVQTSPGGYDTYDFVS